MLDLGRINRRLDAAKARLAQRKRPKTGDIRTVSTPVFPCICCKAHDGPTGPHHKRCDYYPFGSARVWLCAPCAEFLRQFPQFLPQVEEPPCQ